MRLDEIEAIPFPYTLCVYKYNEQFSAFWLMKYELTQKFIHMLNDDDDFGLDSLKSTTVDVDELNSTNDILGRR